MKLELKLGVSTGVLILAMFVSAVFAHLRVKEADRLCSILTNYRLPIIRITRDVRFAPLMGVRALESYMLFGSDPASSDRFRKERRDRFAAGDRSANELHRLTDHFGMAADADRLQDFETMRFKLNVLENETERLNELHTPEGTRQAFDLLHDKIIPLDDTLFESLKGFVLAQEALRDGEILRINQSSRGVIFTLWTATFLGAGMGGMLSFLVARRVTRGIDLVSARANAIASGDLTGCPLDVDSQDQIGSLALAMQQMQQGLASIIGTVVETAGSLTESAVSMRSSSDHIHRRIDQQTQQTRQAATAMQEMSASIAEVSRHTQSAAETARSAAKTAHEGGDIVKQMLGSMHSIATAVSDTSSTVGLLGEDSRRISQIVTVIDEIARKTNLLALNAAIEAARAGEQGRGFAVVAGEVRHLAESTAEATGKISAMIQGVQERTGVAVASMVAGTLIVEQGVVTTTQAGEALERIIGMAERVDRMITQIAIAASQQATAADESSCSLDSIHSLSHDNLAEIASNAVGIESLRGTAAALERQVERFRLDTPAGSGYGFEGASSKASVPCTLLA